MTTTYRHIVAFVNAASAWRAREQEKGAKDRSDSKFGYAVKRVMKRAQTIVESYNDQIEDFRNDHAAVYKNGEKADVIIRDAGIVSMTKEGAKVFNAAARNLFKSSVDIEPFIASVVPADLTDDERDAMEGFVIPAPVEDALAKETK